MRRNKRILVAPLNWGLGHAARCVPVIESLLRNRAEVVMASDGAALRFLQNAFPGLPAHRLPGMRIRYTRLPFYLDMAWQAPRIGNSIAREHRKMRNILVRESIDGIISDHRYGLWHDHLPTAIICHQVRFMLPPAASWLNNLHQKMLRRFDFLWIPDFDEGADLSGVLGHDHPFSRAVYIGPLSQFAGLNPGRHIGKNDLCVVISGPENGRTHFERLIVAQLNDSGHRAVIVGGKPDDDTRSMNGRSDYHAHLQGSNLLRAIGSAKVVLCRSGYSSLMDLAMLGRKAIIVPTPGQTEQEYLAEYHAEKRHWHGVEESSLDIARDFKAALQLNPPVVQKSRKLLDQTVKAFLSVC